MTIEEAIKELHEIRPRGGIIPQSRAEAIDIAVVAMRAQQEREKGCKFCNTSNDREETNVSYCPHCGRKLSVPPLKRK